MLRARIPRWCAIPAGGGSSFVAQQLADALPRALGEPVVVVHRPGDDGTLAVEAVAHAAPDGRTLLVGSTASMLFAPLAYGRAPFDPLQDFEMVGEIADVPMMLVGSTRLPARSLRELIPQLRANAAGFSLANAGIGSASHLCGLILMSGLNAEMTTVPYKGTAPALVDLMAGQVNLMCDQTTNTTGQITSGKVKAYAVTTTKRLTTPGLEKLPTLDESGLKGFNVSIWHGLYARRARRRRCSTR